MPACAPLLNPFDAGAAVLVVDLDGAVLVVVRDVGE